MFSLLHQKDQQKPSFSSSVLINLLELGERKSTIVPYPHAVNMKTTPHLTKYKWLELYELYDLAITIDKLQH